MGIDYRYILTAKILSKNPFPVPPWWYNGDPPALPGVPPLPYPAPVVGLLGTPADDAMAPVPELPAPYPALAPRPLPPAEATALPSSAKEADAWKPPHDADTDSPFLVTNVPDGMISCNTINIVVYYQWSNFNSRLKNAINFTII